MPATWNAESNKTLGYVAPLNEENAEYLATVKVQRMLDAGKTEHQVILAWNAGPNAKKCSKGVNKFGVAYNSCAYVAKYRKPSQLAQIKN